MLSAPDNGELELRDYLAVMIRRRRLIVSITAAIVVTVVGLSFVQTPIYRSTAKVLLRPKTAEKLLTDEQAALSPQMAQVQTQTEIEVMTSNSVRDAVADALGFRPSVSVKAQEETEVVSISAESPSAERSAQIANTYAEVYVQTRRETLVGELLAAMDEVQAQIDQLDAEQARLDEPSTGLESRRLHYLEQLDRLQLSSELSTGGAQVVSRADVPSSPVKPTPLRNGLLAFVLGLSLAVAVAFMRDHLDDSLRSKEDLEQASGGIGLLGMVPLMADWKDQDRAMLVSLAAPTSAPAEAYRTLRTSLQFIGLEHSTRITQITSPGPSDGKTTTLSNLGVSLARAGQRVLMVDCDLRRPRLHEFFGMTNAAGFTSVLLGTTPHASAIRQVRSEGHLALLPSGPPPPNPAELLSSARTEHLFELLAADYDFVLVDGPPILPVTDGLVLAQLADATIVVVAAGSTRRRDAARAFELLGQVNAPVVGSVLNEVVSGGSYYAGYGSYGYGYTYGRDGDARGPFEWPWRRRWSRGERPDVLDADEEAEATMSGANGLD